MSQRSFEAWKASQNQAVPQQHEPEPTPCGQDEENEYDTIHNLLVEDGQVYRMKSRREIDWQKKSDALEQFKAKIRKIEVTYQEALQTPNPSEKQRKILAATAAQLEEDKQKIAQDEKELAEEQEIILQKRAEFVAKFEENFKSIAKFQEHEPTIPVDDQEHTYVDSGNGTIVEY